jgi:DNA mismatch endonuclease (patch repair protein)
VASTPKSNTQFWLDKFEGNVARDRRTRDALVALGWRVLMVWECELGSMRRASETASRLASQIRQPPDV